jgi:hypothetical protein
MKRSRVCYVIMPFHERYATTYMEAIRPAIAKVAAERGEQWECHRADDIRLPGSITKEIVASLHTADLVIADLTGHNPNVFYELGVVHSAGRPTIIITQQIEELPFDLKTCRVCPYTATDDGLRRLYEYLSSTILDALANDQHLTNPILDFAPIRHAHIILRLEQVQQLESQVTSEVWLIEPSLDTDLKMFGEIIKRNLLERKIKYRYLVPRTRGIIRQWERFVRELGYDSENDHTLEVRTVEPHVVESEVGIFDPYSQQEDVLIMSPREQEFVFWYRVGKTRGESIRDRYEILWENESEPVVEQK